MTARLNGFAEKLQFGVSKTERDDSQSDMDILVLYKLSVMGVYYKIVIYINNSVSLLVTARELSRRNFMPLCVP